MPKEPIAIVGTACRFPGDCNDVAKLWNLLKEPVDVAQDIPPERFNIDRFYHAQGNHHGTTNVRQSYFLNDNVTHFDNKFFAVPPAEAAAIDPQQRLLLEVTYEAIESGGFTLNGLQNTDTAVYVGIMCDDYKLQQSQDLDFLPIYNATGTANSNASSRMSYFFDWHGPSMTIDTACSSSLVAVHEAVQALRNGVTRMAVAAGTNLILFPFAYVAESNLNMLSPTGRSRMWDQDADGYARGEGVAAIVLKTLSAAIEDGDRIECVIREVGINHDGRTTGLTMPSAAAQAALIRRVYHEAGLDPDKKQDRCQFFEAHGTGTPAGDPQEAEALDRAFFQSSINEPDDRLFVGSIKTVIGHTEGTAGLAGLLKACMALKHGIIPPNLLFNRLNPRLEPFTKHLQVPTTALPWPVLPEGTPRRASVNSFGFGGANAHCLLEAYQESLAIPNLADCMRTTLESRSLVPFVFSAAHHESLTAYLEKFCVYLADHPTVDPVSLAHQLLDHKSELSYRAAFASATISQLLGDIKQTMELGKQNSKASFGSQSPDAPSILGIFTGQGAQWAGMGTELLKLPFVNALFRELDLSLATLPIDHRPQWTLIGELSAVDRSRIGEAEISQPLCTAVQLVLVDLLAAAGVQFAAVVGHSSGEIAAAYAAGFLSKADAIRIAYYRGFYAHLAKAENGSSGAMMAAGTSVEDAQELCDLDDLQGKLSVAAENSATSVTLSGDFEAIQTAMATLDEENKFARQLKVDTAYHSPYMLPCAQPYADALRGCDIALRQPPHTAPIWISSVYAKVVGASDLELATNVLECQYWVDNMTKPVQFYRAILECLQYSTRSFNSVVEVGPHPALKGPTTETLSTFYAKQPDYIGTLTRGKSDIISFQSCLASLWTAFGNKGVGLTSFMEHSVGQRFKFQHVPTLPSYAWLHDKVLWAEARSYQSHRSQNGAFHDLLGVPTPDSTSDQKRWRNVLQIKELPWLAGHALQGQTVFPATAYVSLAMEAALQVAEGSHVRYLELHDLDIVKAIALSDTSGTELLVTLSNITEQANGDSVECITAEFHAHSAVASSSSTALSLNCVGRVLIALADGSTSTTVLPTRTSTPVNMSEVDIKHFYDCLREDIGYVYEGPFQGLTGLERKFGSSSGTIRNPVFDEGATTLLFHPALADCALQGMFATVSAPGDGMISSIRVPKSCRRVTVVPPLCGTHMPGEVVFDCTMTDTTSDLMPGDVEIYTPGFEQKIIEFEGLTFAPFTPPTSKDDRCLFQESVWLPVGPDGDLTVKDRHPTPEQKQKALDAERAAFFYLKQAHLSVKQDVRESLPWYRQAFLDYAAKVHAEVVEGKHVHAAHWLTDTHDFIVDMMDEYGNDADFNLTKAVGENILTPQVLTGEANILEFMTENNALTRYYEKAAGFEFLNESVASMMSQLTDKFPHMLICEVGAGTGGATKSILEQIGTNYTSYVYTDISSGFFEGAKEKLRGHTSKLNFKTLNIENDPVEQGFIEHSFDCIIAANVLHATPKLEDTMRNVHRLLKPGGYLVMFEVITEDVMRFGAVMGGLPGWWVGRNDNRQYAPTISLAQWDSLFKRTGFSGVDTATPNPDRITIPQSIFCTMAIDENVANLREPLVAAPASNDDTLIILGRSSSDAVTTTVKEISVMLQCYFKDIYVVDGLDHLPDVPGKSHVLALADCEGSIFEDMNDSRWSALQLLLNAPKSILWVTKGAYQENFKAGVSMGLIRNLFYELLETAIHLLDFGGTDDLNPSAIATLILQIQKIHQLKQQGKADKITWTVEPELRIHKQRLEMLRVRPQVDQNARLNSIRRPIKQMSAVNDGAKYLELIGDVYALREGFHSPQCSDSSKVTLKATTSLLPAIRTALGFVHICVATNEVTGHSALCCGEVNASQVTVDESWVFPLGTRSVIDTQFLSVVTGELIVHELLRAFPAAGGILCHEINAGLASLLSKQLLERGQRCFFTTSDPVTALRSDDWILLHGRSTARKIAASIPQDIACFLDGSLSLVDTSLTSRIKANLPKSCQTMIMSSLFARTASRLPRLAPLAMSQVLQEAAKVALSMTNGVPDGAPLETLTLQKVIGTPNMDDIALLDWLAEPTAPLAVRPILTRKDLFNDHVTYWLAGLSGDLGRSLTDFMIAHGARYVALSSRRPQKDESWVSRHESEGAHVRYFQNDITDYDAVKCTLEEIEKGMPAVGGVGNGAMVLSDGVFSRMALENFERVTRPKVEGTMNLVRLFAQDKHPPLDWFIAFSSFVATRGNPGQVNYCAANCGMKALINQRRAQGLAASSFDISRVVGVGYVDRELRVEGRLTKEQKERLVTGSMSMPMSESDLHQAFAEAVVAGRPGSRLSPEIITGIAPVYKKDANLSLWPGNPKFGLLVRDEDEVFVDTGAQSAQVPVKQLLQLAQSFDEMRGALKDAIASKVRAALFFSPSDDLPEFTPLIDMGVDSLVGVEIRGWCLKEMAVDVPVMKILGGVSIAQLTDDVLSGLSGELVDRFAVPSAPANVPSTMATGGPAAMGAEPVEGQIAVSA